MYPRPLIGRDAELALLAELVDGVRAGQGAALRIEGTPGVGKSALLGAIDGDGLPVLRASGVETEVELPFAGLDELLRPLGLDLGGERDPAARLRDVAARLAASAPLLVLVDDVQWLDPSSLTAVAYLARRAEALGIGVVCVWSLRGVTPDEWPGVPVLP